MSLHYLLANLKRPKKPAELKMPPKPKIEPAAKPRRAVAATAPMPR